MAPSYRAALVDQRAGIGHYALPDARRRCSLAIVAGADVKMVETMLGHASAS